VLSRLQSSPTQRRPGQPARCRRPVVSIPAALRSALLALLLPRAQDFTINLKETDIQELIKFVAEATDTTIVVDPAVKGKVKVVSSRPVNRDELYDLFLAILDVHGYTAVSSGGVVRIIQNKDARSASVPVADGLPGRRPQRRVRDPGDSPGQYLGGQADTRCCGPWCRSRHTWRPMPRATRSSFPIPHPTSVASATSSSAWTSPRCRRRTSWRCATPWPRTWCACWSS
jgi:hypothetical protein